MKKLRFIFLTLSLILLISNSCTPTPPPSSPPPPPPSSCPPYGVYYKTPTLAGGDVSSGEIYANTRALENGSSPWCTPKVITIAVVNVSTLPPCPTTKGCLKTWISDRIISVFGEVPFQIVPN